MESVKMNKCEVSIIDIGNYDTKDVECVSVSINDTDAKKYACALGCDGFVPMFIMTKDNVYINENITSMNFKKESQKAPTIRIVLKDSNENTKTIGYKSISSFSEKCVRTITGMVLTTVGNSIDELNQLLDFIGSKTIKYRRYNKAMYGLDEFEMIKIIKHLNISSYSYILSSNNSLFVINNLFRKELDDSGFKYRNLFEQ